MNHYFQSRPITEGTPLLVDNETISQISRGLMVLVGIGIGQCRPVCWSKRHAERIALCTRKMIRLLIWISWSRKCRYGGDIVFLVILSKYWLNSLTLRVFDDANGNMWKSSVKDIAGEVLCVSQFTLFANTSKGNKPDFHKAMVNRYAVDVDSSLRRCVRDRLSHATCTQLFFRR